MQRNQVGDGPLTFKHMLISQPQLRTRQQIMKIKFPVKSNCNLSNYVKQHAAWFPTLLAVYAVSHRPTSAVNAFGVFYPDTSCFFGLQLAI